MMRIAAKIAVLLVILLMALPMNSTAVSISTSKHEYGISETIRIRIHLNDEETGYRLTITDPNNRRSTFERYDLESDETYTVRLTASQPTGKRTMVIRSYDDDGDRRDKEERHYHVIRMPRGPPEEKQPTGNEY